MVTEHVHWSFPTLFDTSILYSEVSPLSAVRIFMLAMLSFRVILYLRPLIISFPSLNHLTLRSGLPEIVHSNVAESPAVTLMDSAGSTILAGSGIKTDSLVIKTEEFRTRTYRM